MIQYKIIISKDAPSQRDCMWAKPVEGGYALYVLESGTWKPVKVMEDNNTKSTADDVVQKAILGVKVNNSELTPNSKKAVNITVVEGTVDGTIKVNGSNVAVHGLAAAAFMKSGTFENKPAEPVAGQTYFCTDKQTDEGKADGIIIYYNGTNWVDALGRTIS